MRSHRFQQALAALGDMSLKPLVHAALIKVYGCPTADDLGQRVALGADDGFVVNLRRLLHDLVEEYGRHTGHADLLREAVDGRVGEDPPSDYRPW